MDHPLLRVWGQEYPRGRDETPTVAGSVDRWVEGLTQGIRGVFRVRPSSENAFSGFSGPLFFGHLAQNPARGHISGSGSQLSPFA